MKTKTHKIPFTEHKFMERRMVWQENIEGMHNDEKIKLCFPEDVYNAAKDADTSTAAAEEEAINILDARMDTAEKVKSEHTLTKEKVENYNETQLANMPVKVSTDGGNLIMRDANGGNTGKSVGNKATLTLTGKTKIFKINNKDITYLEATKKDGEQGWFAGIYLELIITPPPQREKEEDSTQDAAPDESTDSEDSAKEAAPEDETEEKEKSTPGGEINYESFESFVFAGNIEDTRELIQTTLRDKNYPEKTNVRVYQRGKQNVSLDITVDNIKITLSAHGRWRPQGYIKTTKNALKNLPEYKSADFDRLAVQQEIASKVEKANFAPATLNHRSRKEKIVSFLTNQDLIPLNEIDEIEITQNRNQLNSPIFTININGQKAFDIRTDARSPQLRYTHEDHPLIVATRERQEEEKA